MYFMGFGNIDEAVLDAGGASVSVSLPDNWYEMNLQQQETWLSQSSFSPDVAALIEDQLSIGPGPGANPPGPKMIQTPFGTFKQQDVLLYGGLGLLAIILLGVVSSR